MIVFILDMISTVLFGAPAATYFQLMLGTISVLTLIEKINSNGMKKGKLLGWWVGASSGLCTDLKGIVKVIEGNRYGRSSEVKSLHSPLFSLIGILL